MRELVEQGVVGGADKIAVGASLPRFVWEFAAFADLRETIGVRSPSGQERAVGDRASALRARREQARAKREREFAGPNPVTQPVPQPPTESVTQPVRQTALPPQSLTGSVTQPVGPRSPLADNAPPRVRRTSVRDVGTTVGPNAPTPASLPVVPAVTVPIRPVAEARRRVAAARNEPPNPYSADDTVPPGVSTDTAPLQRATPATAPRFERSTAEPVELALLDEFAGVFEELDNPPPRTPAPEPPARPRRRSVVSRPTAPSVPPTSPPRIASPSAAVGSAPEPPASAVRMSTDANNVLNEVQRLVDRVEAEQRAKAKVELTPEVRRAGSPRGRPRRMSTDALVVATPPNWEGTATRGDVVYHVGTARDGVVSTLPVFGVALAVVVAIMLFTQLDQGESTYAGGGLYMPIIRACVLSIGAIVGVRLVRAESLSRLGFRGASRPALIAAAGALIAGVCGFVLVPFDLSTEAAPTLGLLLGLAALRAVSEALFFEGFVHRTLLVEFSSPFAPHAVTVAMYAVWVNTYAFLWDPTATQPVAGAPRLALFVALPAAYAFYRSRAWYIAAWIRWVALGTAAFAAWSQL